MQENLEQVKEVNWVQWVLTVQVQETIMLIQDATALVEVSDLELLQDKILEKMLLLVQAIIKSLAK